MSDENQVDGVATGAIGRYEYVVIAAEVGQRLDAFLCGRLAGLPRARARSHIEDGHVCLTAATGQVDARLKPSTRTQLADVVVLDLQPRHVASAGPEAMDLEILYEDDDLLVLNKPHGLVVHPAAGHLAGTLVNALMHHVPTLEGVGDSLRPGLVHRIDKDTSGLMVVSKNETAMRRLARAFARHDIERRYVAITLGRLLDQRMTFDTLHGRHPRHRKRFTAHVSEGKRAITHVEVVARSALCTLVLCQLETGRSHQIRMHFAECGHPIAGDALYGGVRNHPRTPRTVAEIALLGALERQALHACTLGFRHPRTGESLRFEAPLPADLAVLVAGLFGADCVDLPAFSPYSPVA